jgi:hypothetical protein
VDVSTAAGAALAMPPEIVGGRGSPPGWGRRACGGVPGEYAAPPNQALEPTAPRVGLWSAGAVQGAAAHRRRSGLARWVSVAGGWAIGAIVSCAHALPYPHITRAGEQAPYTRCSSRLRRRTLLAARDRETATWHARSLLPQGGWSPTRAERAARCSTPPGSGTWDAPGPCHGARCCGHAVAPRRDRGTPPGGRHTGGAASRRQPAGGGATSSPMLRGGRANAGRPGAPGEDVRVAGGGPDAARLAPHRVGQWRIWPAARRHGERGVCGRAVASQGVGTAASPCVHAARGRRRAPLRLSAVVPSCGRWRLAWGAGSGCVGGGCPRRGGPEPRTGADRAQGRRCCKRIGCGAAAHRGRSAS